MAARPRRTDRGKALRLACWNADGVHGRKLELEHLLIQHGVDICLLSETFLNPEQTFRLANYVCHRTDRSAGRGHRHTGPRWHSLPLRSHSEPDQSGGTAIQIMLAPKPVINLVAYLSPFRPVIGADLDACFGGWLPVLLAGDLNAKHVDWNSRLRKRWRILLRDYADENFGLLSTPWHSLPLSSNSGPHPSGGNCHTNYASP
jgi:hypothetical protein